MQRCLQLAANGLGSVAPNPMVGAVIVHNNEVIGEGYHQKYGGPHAEINAIHSVQDKSLLKDATLYVSLEPCNHFGKTPPCTNAILEYGIPRVVVAAEDVNPQVAGKGIQRLREAGVEVITGILRKEADELNKRFVTFFNKRRPCVILKWAQSADGFMAPNEPRQVWLTGEPSRQLVHKWRTEEQAILVGARTAQIDNCQLTSRLWPGKNPVRLVIDKNLELKSDSAVFNDDGTRVIVFNFLKQNILNNCDWVKLSTENSIAKQVADWCFANSIQSLIVEGGPSTLNYFINENLWDEARVFTAPKKLQIGIASPNIAGQVVLNELLLPDALKIYRQLS